MGVSAQTIHSWERRMSTPRAQQRASLAAVPRPWQAGRARPDGGGDLARREAHPQSSKMSGMAGLYGVQESSVRITSPRPKSITSVAFRGPHHRLFVAVALTAS